MTRPHILTVTGFVEDGVDERVFTLACPGAPVGECGGYRPCLVPDCPSTSGESGASFSGVAYGQFTGGVVHGVEHRIVNEIWMAATGECFYTGDGFDGLAAAVDYLEQGKPVPLAAGEYLVIPEYDDEGAWSLAEFPPAARVEDILGRPVGTDELASTVRDLGVLALRFGEVPRGTFHADGKTVEMVTTHTVMLGLLACSLAEVIDRTLSPGVIAQLALVHDLPEVHAGDTSTLRLASDEELGRKKDREAAASRQISRTFGRVLPWVPITLGSYERALCREANFVWGVDKITPKVTHIANGCTAPRQQGVTVAELTARYAVQRGQMVERCGEWPALIAVYDRLVGDELEVLAAELADDRASSTT